MNLLTFRPASSWIADAVRTTRRPAAKIAGFGALLFIACCIARSDARIAVDQHLPIDASTIVGTWDSGVGNRYGPTARAIRAAFNNARESGGVVASTQGVSAAPDGDGFASAPARVAPLHIVTEVRMHRVATEAPPELQFSAHLGPGQRRTLHAGVHGAAWVTERITFWNDAVVDRQEMSREVVRAAKPAVVLVGAPKTLSQLRSMTAYRNIASMTMIATAYTAETATAYPTGFTATGVAAHQGIVAVDPHVIPLGTTVFVPGYGLAVAADTGGAIVGRRIDLCMDSYGDAVNFGRQSVQVYIVKR